MKFCNIANLYIVPLLTCWTLYREVHTGVLTGDQISLTVDVNILIGPWEIKKKKKIIHVYLIPRLSVTATFRKNGTFPPPWKTLGLKARAVFVLKV